jgi:hypothetical protein
MGASGSGVVGNTNDETLRATPKQSAGDRNDRPVHDGSPVKSFTPKITCALASLQSTRMSALDHVWKNNICKAANFRYNLLSFLISWNDVQAMARKNEGFLVWSLQAPHCPTLRFRRVG